LATETQVGGSGCCTTYKSIKSATIIRFEQLQLQVVHPCGTHSGVWPSNPCICPATA
jgi:hypothetical protein